MAAGMLAKNMANQQAVSRQNQLQQAMQSYQLSKAKGNEQAINQLVDQQKPDARAKELAALNASRQASMQATVDQARAASPVTQAAGTNTSADYGKASEASANVVAARMKRAIEQLGVMGAHGEQGIAQGLRFGRAAGTVSAGNEAISNVGNAYTRDMENVVPNPMLSLAGDAGMAIGGGMLAKSFGAPKVASVLGTGIAPGASGQGLSLDSGTPGLRLKGNMGLSFNRAFQNWGR